MAGNAMAYDGGALWAVRWNEVGSNPQITQCDGEVQARGFHQALSTGYKRQGRADKPELLTAAVTWQAVQ